MMNHILRRIFTVLSLTFLLDRANGCYIGQADSGECVKARYVLEGKLEFCGQGYSWFELHPDYEVCVPMDTVSLVFRSLKDTCKKTSRTRRPTVEARA